jgi:hypothetical protein
LGNLLRLLQTVAPILDLPRVAPRKAGAGGWLWRRRSARRTGGPGITQTKPHALLCAAAWAGLRVLGPGMRTCAYNNTTTDSRQPVCVCSVYVHVYAWHMACTPITQAGVCDVCVCDLWRLAIGDWLVGCGCGWPVVDWGWRVAVAVWLMAAGGRWSASST